MAEKKKEQEEQTQDQESKQKEDSKEEIKEAKEEQTEETKEDSPEEETQETKESESPNNKEDKEETPVATNQQKPTTYQEAAKKKKRPGFIKAESKKLTSKFDTKKKQTKRRLSQLLADFIERAGYDISSKLLIKKIFFIDIYIMAAVTTGLILYFSFFASFNWSVIKFIVALWTVILAAVFIASLLAVIIFFEYRVSQRARQIENVLPDFLQLASANISAGMPIDRALWFAVRPRFGALAEEMEEIAKATFTGTELEHSLVKFSEKYNSRILRESVNLIVVGLKSGGELGELLNKVSENIQATKLMKQEISASVTTYVIFITVASIIAAPLLLALSSQLLDVVREVSGSMNIDSSATSSASLPFALDFSGESVTQSDFFKFALVLMIITSFFASLIVSVIQKGTPRDGFSRIPVFFVVSFLTFLGSRFLLGFLLGGLI